MERSYRIGRSDLFAAAFLGIGTAIVVVWQNSRLAILWDLSYVLENASRIARGQIVYRDFVIPYAPLTFLTQGAIIRLFGRHYELHVGYAAAAAAMATAITYFIVRMLGTRTTVASLLCAPLTFLGIYCILPHPFYDPDCCLAVLVAIAISLAAGQTAAPVLQLLAGAASVVPMFVKQNIGLPFLAAMVVMFLITRNAAAMAGVLSAMTIAILTIAATSGLSNYIHWTFQFAAQRRMPPVADYVSIYNDSTLWWWLAVTCIGVLLTKWSRISGGIVATIPWIWCAVRFFITDDELEFEENLIRLWPLLIVVAVIVVAIRRPKIAAAPLGALAAILGSFLSQQAWGSTYGIWPLLIVLIAFVLPDDIVVASIVSAVMLLHAVPYVVNNNRLTYAKWNEGEVHRSTLASLRGLSIHGQWLPDFEELVAWTDRNIPRDDAILSLPGEDLFYFTTGRTPHTPVVMFDHTINPYDSKTIASWNVKWVIVKRRLQVNGTPMQNENEVLQLMQPRLRLIARLRNYDVYAVSV